MTNIAISILGWLVFFSIVGYISFLVVTEIINVVRTKSQIALNESKQLEHEVDEEIKRANDIINSRQQPSLFDEQ